MYNSTSGDVTITSTAVDTTTDYSRSTAIAYGSGNTTAGDWTGGGMGGGIANNGDTSVFGTSSTITINEHTQVNNNIADRHGGGIVNYSAYDVAGPSGNVTITDSTVNSNIAGADSSHGNGNFNDDGGSGGGIANAEGTVLVESSSVDQNRAYYSPTTPPFFVPVFPSTFPAYGYNGHGGGIFSYGTNSTVTIQSTSSTSTVNDNLADKSGGGIINLFGSTLNIDASQVNGNIAGASNGISPINHGSQFDETQGGSGGGIFNGFYSTTNITSASQVNLNSAYSNYLTGGILFRQFGAGAGIYMTWMSTLNVTDSFVNLNEADHNGGGVYIFNTSTATFTNSQVNSNDAGATFATHGGNFDNYGGDGGGISTYFGNVIVTSTSSVNYNSAYYSNGPGAFYPNGTGGNGGGIYSEYSYITVSANSTVDINHADQDGGGIFATYTVNPGAFELLVQNSSVSGNTAGFDDGIDAYGGDGGGLFITGGVQAHLETATVHCNNAIAGALGGGFGGGVYSTGEGYYTTYNYINNTSIQFNEAQYSGGGIYNTNGSTLTIANGSTINNNVAGVDFGNSYDSYGNGGGIYNSGPGAAVNVSAGNVVNNNIALSGYSTALSMVVAGNGGGIFNTGTGASVTVTGAGAQVNNNIADRSGGGIYNTNDATVTIDQTATVNNNIAGADSFHNLLAANGDLPDQGGDYNNPSCLNDITFDQNGGNGGGIFNDAAGPGIELTIDNGSQVNGNVAFNYGGYDAMDPYGVLQGVGAFNGNGGGIYNYGNSNILIGSTAASYINNNIADRNGGGIHNSAGGAIDILYGSQVNSNKAGYNVDGVSYGASDLNFDPLVYGNGGGIFNQSGGEIYIGILGGAAAYVNGNAAYGSGNTNYGGIDGGGQGGGIFNRDAGSHVDIYNGSQVNNNLADRHGGGIFNINQSYILVDGSYVDNNVAGADINHGANFNADGGSGGGIANAIAGTVTVQNASSITHNAAYWTDAPVPGTAYAAGRAITGYNGHGGGVFNHGAGTTFNLNSGSSVYQNYADKTGGGIANSYGATTNVDASFVNQNIAGATINQTGSLGGGIAFNNDQGGSGGGIVNHADGYVNITAASEVNENRAYARTNTNDWYGAGGGIYNVFGQTDVNTPHNLFVQGSEIDGNLADHDGGGIYQHLASAELDDTDVTNNVAGAFRNLFAPYGQGPAFDFNGGDGGGIKNHDSFLDINTGSAIDYNTALYGLTVEQGGAPNYDIFFNVSGGNGGGIFNESENVISTVNITSSTVNYNNAEKHGGGIYSTGTMAYVTATSTDISFNTAGFDDGFTNGTFPVYSLSGGNGGGVYNTNGSDARFYASTIHCNDAIAGLGKDNTGPGLTTAVQGGNGGGIVNNGVNNTDPGETDLLLNDTTVQFNEAQYDGGGLWAAGADSDVDITNYSIIQYNVAGANIGGTGFGYGGNGGGIYNADGSDINIDISGILNNYAVGGALLLGNGGGIFNTGTGSTVTVTGNSASVDNNKADRDGGGVFNTSGASLLVDDYATVGNNVAGADTNYDVPAPINACMEPITFNADGGYGGGIFNNAEAAGIDVTISNSAQVNGNFAFNGDGRGGDGGGVYNSGAASDVVVNSDADIRFNLADRDGGGIFNTLGGQITVDGTGTSVNYNTAGASGGNFDSAIGGNGGGIFNDAAATGTDVTVSGSATVRYNYAYANGEADAGNGGGIFNSGTGSDVVVNSNADIRFNLADRDGGGIFNTLGGQITVDGIGTSVSYNTAGANPTGGRPNFDGTIGGNGGGIFNDAQAIGTDVTVSGSAQVNNNEAYANGEADAGNGGGIFNSGAGSDVMVNSGADVNSNEADRDGGGIFNTLDGQVTVDGSGTYVKYNTAGANGGYFNSAIGGNGGGIFNDAMSAATDVTVSNGAYVNRNDAYANGEADAGNGGGIFNSGAGSDVMVNSGAYVKYNEADRDGGGIFNTLGGQVTVDGTGTSVNYNTAGANGGYFNSAIGGNGGGIFNDAMSAANDVTLSGSATVRYNYAYANGEADAGNGGGIFNSGAGSDVVVNTNADIRFNLADRDGGGIFNTLGGQVTVDGTGTSVNYNTAGANPTGGRPYFDGAIGGNGGGIFNDAQAIGTDVTVSGSAHVYRNEAYANGEADAGNGGGIFNSGAGSDVLISTAAYVNYNEADRDGGGIFNTLGGQVTVDGLGTSVNYNTAGASGGYFDSAIGGNGGGIFNDASGGISVDAQAGTKYSNYDVIVRDGSQVNGNSAFDGGDDTGNGGGIYNTGSSKYTSGSYPSYIINGPSNILIQNDAHVDSNSADQNGGGIFNTYNGFVMVEGGADGASSVNSNLAGADTAPFDDMLGGNGGGIFNGEDSFVTIHDNATVNTNIALRGDDNGGDGGGIFNDGFALLSYGFNVDNNIADRNGGGIENQSSMFLTGAEVDLAYGSSKYTDPTVTAPGSVTGNIAGADSCQDDGSLDSFVNLGSFDDGGGSGGGIFNSSRGGTDSVIVYAAYDVSIGNNHAYYTATVNNNGEDNNWAVYGYYGHGGGVYNTGADATAALVDVDVTGNAAERSGGGIFNAYEGQVVAKYSSIDNNVAGANGSHGTCFDALVGGSGGGIANSYGGTAVIYQSSVDGNHAYSNNSTDVYIGAGGGIYNTDSDYGPSTVGLKYSSLNNNTADYNGGGIYNWASNVFVYYSTINGNSSINGSGGGLYSASETNDDTYGNAPNVLVSLSEIRSNSAGVNGGGVANVDGSDIYITRSTIGGPTTDDAANRLAGNTAFGNGGGLFNADTGSYMLVYQSLVADNSSMGTGTYDGGGGLSNQFGGYAILANTTVAGNYAYVNGGAVNNYQGTYDYNTTTTVGLINTTIVNNTGYNGTGGIFNDNFGGLSYYGQYIAPGYPNINYPGSTVRIGNSILSSNTGGNSVGGLNQIRTEHHWRRCDALPAGQQWWVNTDLRPALWQPGDQCG